MFLTLENMRERKYSFQKVVQISHRNNVQDTPASNIEAFFQEILCFFHSQEWSYFPQRCWSSHLKIPRGRQYSFQKKTKFSSGDNV
jgi:hypothetical protein